MLGLDPLTRVGDHMHALGARPKALGELFPHKNEQLVGGQTCGGKADAVERRVSHMATAAAAALR